jgi:hypothetical protein
MQLSSILVALMVLLFVAFVISYTVLSTVRPSFTTSLAPKQGRMNISTKLGGPGDARDKFLVPPGATLMVYLFCAVNSKTPQIGATQDPITILQIGSTLQLQILPGGVSTKPKTRLNILTQGPNSSYETIELADFPEQKWVHLSIVREGRRYTVYYNGKVVASQRTQYFPVINSSQFKIGDPRLQGQYVRPRLAPTPYHSDEIQQDMLSSSDTRHEPYKYNDVTAFFQYMFSGCPKGLFCFSTPQTPSTNPLKMWQTPYA